MRKNLLFICLLALCSCDEVLIEENRRIEVKGTLRSVENEPLTGFNIFAAGSRNGDLSMNTDKILGRGTSNNNGSFEFISLDTYSHGFVLAINPVEIENSENHASAYFYDATGDHSSNYDLGEFRLPRKIDFQLDIRNVSGTSDTLRYVMDFQRPVLRYIYQNGGFVENDEGNNYISIRQHTSESDPVSVNLQLLEASEFEFAYRIGDSPLQEVSISVDSENNSYELEY
ncbi:hypothetical protein ML462_05025 [Gramella lutea]|uniref:Uncharacterized protein n=1 Tax=Christiangramia lutea TaxID=1607951 RepID=A0A9X1V1M3_9FLAO|nr:hypothetical protein [Christiangramia lutea]MCH4822528.1 hypothetical protein [Christiangramia lutea]